MQRFATKLTASFAAAAIVTIAMGADADVGDKYGAYKVEDRRSGFTYATKETQRIQVDDFENPAMIWVDDGEALWNKAEGEASKSCASCHNDAAESMKGVATVFPKYDPKLGRMKNVEKQINICRTERMKAKPWKLESNEMLAMTVYVRHQSRGMPMNVKVDGEVAPFFEAGKKFYYQRRGQLDLACGHCHVDNPGGQMRANILSQGQSNGFPTYRLKWQRVGSIHRRFRGCNKQVRAIPYKAGSEEYTNLELYVAWRGRGLPVETPAVRN